MEEKGKKLGLWNIIGLGLGGAIGTGIFVLLGYGIAYTGRSISLVVAIGCFFILLAYWYNLAMPAMFVMKGGDYSMKAMLFNPFMSGVSAWMILVNGLAMSSYSVLWHSICHRHSQLAKSSDARCIYCNDPVLPFHHQGFPLHYHSGKHHHTGSGSFSGHLRCLWSAQSRFCQHLLQR